MIQRKLSKIDSVDEEESLGILNLEEITEDEKEV